MHKSKSFHDRKARARAQHKADKRRQQKHAPPAAKRDVLSLWIGDRRPVIAPKSGERMLFRMEQRQQIPPRAVRMAEYRQKIAANKIAA